MEAANDAREQGNGLFKRQDYANASQKYVEALELLAKVEPADAARRESEHKCRLNRAACLMKLQGYVAARRECEAVLSDDADNAKAHWRLGQALEALGELTEAQKGFTASIKLNPQLREPRDALDALKARQKANPQLENMLQDLRTVEERALRALHIADLPRARQQMELLLKDARAHKEPHWEARALLALAQLCAAQAETEAAGDYVRSAGRVVGEAADRRGLACLQLTEGALAIDGGRAAEAISKLSEGLLLSQELGDAQLTSRFLAQLGVAHGAQLALPTAIELGMQALAQAREQGDKYSEAVAAANLGVAFRATGSTKLAVEHLALGLGIGEQLGYSSVISVCLGHFALLKLERSRKADRIDEAFKMLRRALAISEANGLLRHAVDDATNLHVAALRWRHGTRTDAITGLEKALASAKEVGYGAARARLSVALGTAMLRADEGGWSDAALPRAYEHLSAALHMADAASNAQLQAEVYGGLSLYHLLVGAARRDEPLAAIEQRAAAVHAARQARQHGAQSRGGADSALELTNLAVALLVAKAAGAGSDDDEAEAKALLESAIELGARHEDVPHGVRAHAALSALHEGRGDLEAAADTLDGAVELYTSWLPLPPHSAARLKIVAMGHHDQQRWAEKLAALKQLMSMLPGI